MFRISEIEDINLPVASRKIMLFLIKKGAECQKMEDTDIYNVKFKGKNLSFWRNFTPAVPYMWGTVLINRRFWTEVLKNSKIRMMRKPPKKHQKLRIFITKDYFHNALMEKPVYLIGDGKKNIGDLVKIENLKRINSTDPLQIPLKVSLKKLVLNKVIKKGKRVLIKDNYDFQNISKDLGQSLIETAKKGINCFPGLGYICFEIFTKDYRKSGSSLLGNVFISPGINIFAKLIVYGHQRETCGILVRDMLLRS